MLLFIDVHYSINKVKAVGIIFDWEDILFKKIIIERIDGVEDYVPGEFYKRELPCLLKIIEKVNLSKIEAIIIDGYVYIDNNGGFGLGGKLWEKLNKQIPIIGIAKSSFFNNKELVREVLRGESKKPLFISSIGYDEEKLIENVLRMKGKYRIPTILKQLDTITKEP